MNQYSYGDHDCQLYPVFFYKLPWEFYYYFIHDLKLTIPNQCPYYLYLDGIRPLLHEEKEYELCVHLLLKESNCLNVQCHALNFDRFLQLIVVHEYIKQQHFSYVN